MFTLFLDDSGQRPNHKIAVATALIIPSAQISNLGKEWEAFKKKEGFQFFHASPCNAKDKKSEFANWDDKKVDRVFARVRQITRKYGVIAISASLKKDVFDETIPVEYRKYVYEHHYSWCVSYAIAYAERWRTASGRTDKPFEFFFDWMDLNDPRRKEIEKAMDYSERASREEGRQGDYEKYAFSRGKCTPGLQCADDIAWTCNRYALYRIEGEDIPVRAKKGWDSYEGDMEDRGFLHAFTFDRQALEKHVIEIFSDGRTLKRFRRWEQEDSERKIL